MLYQDYKDKINRRVKIRRILRRYRVPIISAISTIIILIAAFMVTKGMVFGDSLENNKIEYGNKPAFTASAVFSDVRYEFSKAQDDTWTTTVPVLLGEYKMRVVANGVFGERYSDEQSFSIVKRKISVVSNTPTVVYGENPSVTASLAFDDRVECGQFIFEDRTKTQTNVTPVKADVKVFDKNGKDVTSCYQVDVAPSVITFTKRDITLTVESNEYVYNDEYYTYDVWNVTEGNLAFNDDVIKIVDDSFTTEKEAGDFENIGEFRVMTGSVDVTHHYNVTKKSGVLTIKPKPVTVYTNDVEKVYTGQEWYDIDFKVDDSTPLLDGHKMTVSSWNKLATVGEVENALGFTIREDNGNGNDVTSNYCITVACGKIRVLPREITIKTQTVEIEYDGKTHSFTEPEITTKTKLAAGNEFLLVSQTEVKDVVDGLENFVTFDIIDGNENSVISNYVVTYENGTITVTKKKITITSESMCETYNGSPQGIEIVLYDEHELCEGHSLDTVFKTTVTDCPKEPVDNEFDVYISDENGEPVNDNYEVEKIYGTLDLKPLPVSIVTGSANKKYDGTPLFEHSFEYADGSAEFIGELTYEYVNATEITNVNVDTVDNVFELLVLDGDEDKTYNYEISYIYGSLEIERRPIVVTSLGFEEKVYYDGEKHRNEKFRVTPADGYDFALVEGHELTVDFLDDSYVEFAYDGAEKLNWFNVIEIKDTNDTTGDGDMTGNYAPICVYGELKLEKRPVIFVSGSIAEGAIIYDGQWHSLEECFAKEVDESNLLANMGLVDGHTPEGLYFNSIIDAEEIDNSFIVVAILDREGNSVIENYQINGYEAGKLRVAPRPIILISCDDTKMYDGTPLINVDYSVGGMGLVRGEMLNYKNNATLTDVEIDQSGNVIGILNSYEFGVVGGRNRAANYIVVDTQFGTLTVTKRPITLTSQDAKKIYDGKPLYNTNLLIGGYGLANNQQVICSMVASLTDVVFDENGNVASIRNTFECYFAWQDGTEVKYTNYDVTKIETGILTVTKRSATIVITSVIREYDGTPVTPVGFTYSRESYNYGILDIHSVSMNLYGSITKKGEIAIGHDDPVVLHTVGDVSVDKTPNYNLTVEEGTLEVTARKVILNARFEEHEYTGEVIYPTFNANDVSHAQSSYKSGLGLGDTIEVIFTQGWRTELGSSIVKIKNPNGWTMTNKDGEDVTFCYDVVGVNDGKLTVVQREIFIRLHGNYKEYYDGAVIVNNGYTVENFLYNIGHTITFDVTGSQIDVGESYAKVLTNTIVIKDKYGNDASKYYKLIGTEDGLLKIEKKRVVYITSASDFFLYDGQPHKNETYTIDDRCPVPMQRYEEFAITFQNGLMVTPDTYANMFSVEVFVPNTNPIDYTTENYEIIRNFGSITIGGIDIEIWTEGGEKVYDGTPLTNPNAGYYCPNGVPDGLTIEIVTTGSQTDVGSSENGYIIVAYLNGVPFPSEAFNIIREDLGELKVTKLHFNISTLSGEIIYYDKISPFVHNEYETDYYETEASKYLTLSVETTRLIDVGRKDNEVKSVKLLDANGNPVSTDNYSYTVESVGTITMYSAIEISVESDRETFYYDGTAKSHPKHKSPSGYISGNHRLETDGYSSFTEVGEHVNEFKKLDIVDGETGESVIEFYLNIAEPKFDKVTIAPREITIEAPSVVERYENGKVIYAPNEIVLPNEFLDELNNNIYGYEYGYEIDCDMATVAYATQLGVDVEYRIPIEHFYITLNGVRLSQDGFTVDCLPGTLRFSDKLIEIEVIEVIGYYDGTRLEYYEDDWRLAPGQLPDGYELLLDLSGIGLSEVGVVDFDEMLEYLLANEKLRVVIRDENGRIVDDVTDAFEYKFVGTPLTLNKAQLSLTAGSASKIYDGTPLTSNNYYISGGGLEDGHVIKECVVVGSVTEVATELNEIIWVVIVDTNNLDERGNPIDITDNYQIVVYSGTLTVIKDADK